MKYLKSFKLFESYGVYPALEGYLECALWTGEFDDEYVDDIDSLSVDNSRDDIEKFLDELEKKGLLTELTSKMNLSTIGHEFWLTRNGHGSGFWDKDLGELGDKVTEICIEFGEKYIYKGDDEKIYID